MFQRFFVGSLSVFLLVMNTAICFLALLPFAILKAISPVESIRSWATKVVVFLGQGWIAFNSWFLKTLGLLSVDLEGPVPRDIKASYFVWSNHQSWVDIMVLQNALNRKIPFLRFFIKSELIWVPFMGIAWWALDYPFMKRYTKEEIAKDPRKKGVDLKTTQDACAKFRGLNVSILNFLEGTRFTPEKKRALNSPYAHLLPPKIGGVGYVLGAMGSQFQSLIDVTIFYPKGPKSFMSLLGGGVGRVKVHIETVPIPSHLIGRQDIESEDYRKEVQEWVRARWALKDEILNQMALGVR